MKQKIEKTPPTRRPNCVCAPPKQCKVLYKILKQSHGEGIMDSGRELGTGYAHCGTTGVEGPVVGGVPL